MRGRYRGRWAVRVLYDISKEKPFSLAACCLKYGRIMSVVEEGA